MPKKFPQPTIASNAPNIHPSTADPLCDLLYDRADVSEIAEYLRVNDEPNPNLVAPLLVLMVDALPHFQRGLVDGQTADHNKMEAEGVVSWLHRSRPAEFTTEGLAAHRKMITTAEVELQQWTRLAACYAVGCEGCRVVAVIAPALYSDPRSATPADTPVDCEELQRMRLEIVNYAIERKLEIETYDGWPHSLARVRQTRGTMRLVTAEPIAKGLRLS